MRSSALSFAVVSLLALPAFAEPLVGPSVGNADLLVAEGTRLYNEKKFDLAKDHFLKATRANPASVPVYLSLARAYMAVKDVENSCQTYKAYLKAAPEGTDRQKAQSELDLCERQLKQKLPEGSTLPQRYVTMKAGFFDALDKGHLVGAGSASAKLQELLAANYAAPDLGDMAQKLAKAAEAQGDGAYKLASTHQKTDPAELEKGAAAYRLALDAGATPGLHLARASFLDGVALLAREKPKEAEAAFAETVKLDPSDKEARYYRAIALYQSGDKPGALAAREKDLPTDPRTAVLKTALAFDKGSDTAAEELQHFLFSRRFSAK